MLQAIKCLFGYHIWTDKWVGLLHAECSRCGRVRVACPYTYRPSLGRNDKVLKLEQKIKEKSK
jgi:ribosomal protein S27AE